MSKEHKSAIEAMFESSPQVNILLNEDMKIIDCNPAAVKFLMYPDKESLLSQFQNSLEDAVIQVIDWKKNNHTTFSQVFQETLKNGYIEFELRVVEKHGMNAIMKRIHYENSVAVVIYLNEKTTVDEHMRALLDATPMICSIWDENGKMLDCNESALQYFGVKGKDDYVNHFLDLSEEYQNGVPSTELAQHYISETFRVGKQHFYWDYRTVDNKPLPVETTLIRVNWEDGYRLLAYSKDLSEINQVTKELKTQESLLQTVNGIATNLISNNEANQLEVVRSCLEKLGEQIRADNIFIWRNESHDNESYLCSRMIGWVKGRELDVEELHPSISITECIPDWDSKSILTDFELDITQMKENPLVSCAMSEQSKKLLLIGLYIDREFWGFVSCAFQEWEKSLSYTEIGILRSGCIMISSSIVRYEMNQELIHAKEEALASVQAKNEFLARISHEVRTPLNAILGMTTVAKKSNDLSKIYDSLDIVETSSTQLLSIIDDILDISSIDRGKLEIVNKPFLLDAVFESVKEIMSSQFEEKEQSFTLDIDKEYDKLLISDERRLIQVLVNLLSNASKFTSFQGNISLHIREIEDALGKSRLQMEVRDDGIGIEESNKERIFAMFEQEDGSSTRRFGGTGLGLSICKQIITLMGGDIWVQSTGSEGSCFAFEIPAVWEVPEEEVQVPDGTGRKILLAEDIEINQMIVMELLEDTKVEIDCANNGKEAVDMFMENPKKYDLILMDMQMPIMDGISATKIIRESGAEDGRNIPIYSLTANAYEEDKEKCIAAGMNGHILKPINIQILYKAMETAFQQIR